MAKNTVTRRVNLYINGKEAGASIKEVKSEMQKLVNQQARMEIGSKEYIAGAKRIRELKAVISEHNQQLQVTERRWFSLSKMTDGFNKYFGMIGSFLAGLTGVVLGFRKCSDEAGKFEENLDNLSALTGLEGKNLSWLGDQAKAMSVKTTEAGIKIKQSATDILDAFTKMGSQRPELLKNKEALAAVTEDAIILSEAAKMKLEPAAASLANVMNQFNTRSSESRRIINELAAGSQAGSGDIQYLSDAIEKCGTTAYLLGMKTNQAIGVIEAIAPKFKEASQAGNSLDKVLLKLKEKQIGYKTGTFDLNDALDELQTRFAKGERAADLFGVEHSKMAEVLVLAKNDVVRYTEAVTGTDKAFEQAAKNTNNRVTERAQAMNKLKLKMIEVGENIAPAITVSTNAFTYFLNVLVKAPKFYKENKDLIFALVAALIALQGKTILATAAILKGQAVDLLSAIAKKKHAVATIYLDTCTQQYNATQGRLHPALLKTRAAFSLLWKAIVANPLGAIVLGVTALVSAINFLEKNTDSAIKVEKLKNSILTTSQTATKLATDANNDFAKSIQNLNRLSSEERLHLREQISDRIKLTEATLNQLEAEQAELKQAASKATFWQSVKNALRTTNVGGSVYTPTNNSLSAFNDLQQTDALTNGEKAASEMNESIQKVRDSVAGLKDQLSGLNEIFNAEGNADKIGTKTITELQEKVNLYRTALENATIQSEEYNRIQKKIIDTENLLNRAIKEREIPTNVDSKEDKKQAEKENKQAEASKVEKIKVEEDLFKKISEIRNQLNQAGMIDSVKGIIQVQQKYDTLLDICQQYGLDETEVIRLREEEIAAIEEKQQQQNLAAFLAAKNQIEQALKSSSEKEKDDVRQKYQALIDLAEQYGIDTAALKQKMVEELSAIEDDEESRDIFGMSPEDWENLEGNIGMAIELAGQLSDIWGQFNQIKANQEKKELQDYEKDCNRKKELLNKQLNAGKISQEQYNARVSQLDADMDKKKTEIAKRQAKRDKALAITNAMINTASAIMRIWADVPKVDFGVSTAILTALAAATGAAQIAVIASQPLPEYATGGLTDGAKMYIAGEAGQEWISPNWMLKDKTTGPIIRQLEMVRSGILTPEQLVPLAPDFQTMTQIPMFATGGYTYESGTQNNYYTSETQSILPGQEYLERIDQNIHLLCEYLSDPRNRQAVISNDLLERNNEEMNTINRLKRL